MDASNYLDASMQDDAAYLYMLKRTQGGTPQSATRRFRDVTNRGDTRYQWGYWKGQPTLVRLDRAVRRVPFGQPSGLDSRSSLDANPLSIAASLNNIGITLRDLGRYEEALRHYNQALKMHRRFGLPDTHPLPACALRNIYLLVSRTSSSQSTTSSSHSSTSTSKPQAPQ